MAVGQSGNNIAFVIQARMSSSRLPGKALLPIPLNAGKPLIRWIVDEVKKSRHLGKVIVATSVDKSNDVLERYCIDNDIICFRGEESDVLSRYIMIAETEDTTGVVRLTGDNPLVDIRIIDEIIDIHLAEENEYTVTKGLPVGMNVEIVSSTTLQSIRHYELSDMDREHVTLYIKNNKGFKKNIIDYLSNEIPEDIRLTVDYPSDFLVLSTVLELGYFFEASGIELVKKVLDRYPWVFEVNRNNIQKKQYDSTVDELQSARKLLSMLDMHQAVEILKKYDA